MRVLRLKFASSPRVNRYFVMECVPSCCSWWHQPWIFCGSAGCQLDYPQMATIMLTLHGFLLTSCILLQLLPLVPLFSAKATLALAGGSGSASSSGGSDNGDIFAVSSGPQHPQQDNSLADINTIRQEAGGGGEALPVTTISEAVAKEYHQQQGSAGRGGGGGVEDSVNKPEPGPAAVGHHKCPVECTCGRDNDGRLEVLCLRGNSYKSCCPPILAIHPHTPDLRVRWRFRA